MRFIVGLEPFQTVRRVDKTLWKLDLHYRIGEAEFTELAVDS